MNIFGLERHLKSVCVACFGAKLNTFITMRIFAKLKKLFLFRKRRAPKNGYCATMEDCYLTGSLIINL